MAEEKRKPDLVALAVIFHVLIHRERRDMLEGWKRIIRMNKKKNGGVEVEGLAQKQGGGIEQRSTHVDQMYRANNKSGMRMQTHAAQHTYPRRDRGW